MRKESKKFRSFFCFSGRVFGNFSIFRDPNLPQDGTWVNYGPRDHQYLKFNVTMTLSQNFDWEHVAFWNVYIDQVRLKFYRDFKRRQRRFCRKVYFYFFFTVSGIFYYNVLADRRWYKARTERLQGDDGRFYCSFHYRRRCCRVCLLFAMRKK